MGRFLPAEKRKAVLSMIATRYSNVAIARMHGVSEGYVRKLRNVRELASRVSEIEIVDQVCEVLDKAGISWRREVNCGVGAADLVTGKAVYEIKAFLTRERLFSALGQVLIYRQALGVHLKPVIIGKPTKAMSRMVGEGEKYGAHILYWPDIVPAILRIETKELSAQDFSDK
jgi:hypothetical protein